MTIRLLDHGSPDYEEMLRLRITVLLQPIGIPASFINREAETSDLLVGAFENGEMIGCCVLTPRSADLVQLRQMAVKTDQQGKGIGADIIWFAEALLKEKGYATLMMHARNPVIKFYESCGYRIAGEEFFEVGLGHHRMEKMLTATS